MSFFTSIQNQQTYLQNALNSVASQQDLEIQSSETEQSLQNEDNIANQALKSAGMSDLFLGAPVALRGLIEAPAIYEKAKTTYGNLKETYKTIKAKAEEVKNLITSAPEKLQQLREASVDPSMTPESLQAKVVELFGEKIGNGAVGKGIVENLAKFKEAHAGIKAAALEHYASGQMLVDKAQGHVDTLRNIAEKPFESLSSSELAQGLRSSEMVNQIHGALTGGVSEIKSGLPSMEELTSRLEGIKSKVAPTLETLMPEISTEFKGLNKKIPFTFEELAKSGRKAIPKKAPEMTPLEGLRTTGESTLKRSVLEPFMEKVNTLKTATTERLKGLKSQAEDLQNQLTGELPDQLRTNLEAQLQLVKNKISGEVGNISTSNRIASLNEAEPKMVSAAKGEVDLVEEKVASPRNKSFERISPQKDSPFSNLAKEGISGGESGLSSYYSKAKNYLTTLKESSPSKILGGTLGAGLEGLNTFAGGEAAKALSEGKVSAMNVLQASQLKNAPSALQGAISTIGEGVKATGEKGASLVENATNTLNEYASKAKSTISDTFDLLKSKVAESGAEDVAGKIAEKGLGSFLGEAVLGAVPVIGEISDVALGIGSIVEAIKDIGHKAAVAPPQEQVVQGVQMGHAAGVY